MIGPTSTARSGLMLAAVATLFACGTPDFAECTDDSMCKDGRVCDQSICVYPDEASSDGDDDSGDTTGDSSDGDGDGKSCADAIDCSDDLTCTAEDGEGGTCAPYWSCDGFGEGASSQYPCTRSWDCDDVDYVWRCEKVGDAGSRCECLIDQNVTAEIIYDGDGCHADHDDVNLRCGWQVPEPI